MNTQRASHPTEICLPIKPGIDAHAKWYYMARQVGGAAPQPVQKMPFEEITFVGAGPELPGSGQETAYR